jgi:hypothetical protein
VTREAELEIGRAELRNLWRIGEELGHPMPDHLKVHDLVLTEMKFRAGFQVSLAVANLAEEWIRTRNPYLIDQAVILCANANIEPPSALWAEIAAVARQRFDGNTRGGTPDSVRKHDALEQAFTLMLNLRHAGATVEVAASKAARWLAEAAPGQSVKASTLERRYSEKWLVSAEENGPTREEDFINRWEKTKSEEVKAIWEEALKAMPDANDELKGNRR